MSNNRQELLNNAAAVGPQGEGRDSPSRFPRYPAYRCSGVEWLGEMPEHWEVTKLSYVTSRIGSGKTPSGGAAAYASSGVPFIRSQNVHDEGLRLDDIVYIDEETDREMAWSRVRPLDVLINITGASIGRSCQVPAKFGRANVNQHVCVIRLNKAVESSDWVAWFMKSPSSKEQVKVSQTGAAREGLNFEQLAGFYLCMPPLNERNVIAAFLDHETARIDALIEEQQRLIELLKEKRQAVISHAVTKGLDPDALMKDSGVEWLGEVPAHWDVVAIKWLSPVLRGASPRPIDDPKYFDDSGEYAWVRIADVSASDGILRETTQTLSALGASLSVKMEPGEMFLSIAGTVGKPCITQIKACIHDGFVYFPSLSIDNKFLYRIFEVGTCYGGLGKMGTQLNLNTETVGGIQIGVPPDSEIAQILEFIDRQSSVFDSLVGEAAKGVELLQERRSALISAAVTGKIDVRGWQPPADTGTASTRGVG